LGALQPNTAYGTEAEYEVIDKLRNHEERVEDVEYDTVQKQVVTDVDLQPNSAYGVPLNRRF